MVDATNSGSLVGQADAFASAIRHLPVVASADESVLISGETGTGKQLVARTIHAMSPRSAGPFVTVNCDCLLDTQFESELFGHDGGGPSGADAPRQGLIARAARGVLFLDGVEALTPRAQIVLLRVLQDRTFRTVGSPVEHPVDVQFVAATNDRLEPRIQDGRFRADLYYRLCVFTIDLPPLRDRGDDILPLARHFVRKHWNAGSPPPELSADSADALVVYDWPGNVRELESAVVRAVHATTDGIIQLETLGLPFAGTTGNGHSPNGHLSYKDRKRRVLESFERGYLIELMRQHQGNVTRAAHAAGKERRDLGKTLKRLGIDPAPFRR